MKLYFQRAELLLHEVEGCYVLQMAGRELGRFQHQNKAVAEYNRIRRELENSMPPTEATDADKKAILERYLADSLLGHNSYRPPSKKPSKSRTFG